MSEPDACKRTYPLDPDTAEDPCEDCGRDERKHEIGPRSMPPTIADWVEGVSVPSQPKPADGLELLRPAPDRDSRAREAFPYRDELYLGGFCKNCGRPTGRADDVDRCAECW